MSIEIKNPKTATELAGHIEKDGKDIFNAGAKTGALKSDYKFNDMYVPVSGTNLRVRVKPQESHTFDVADGSIQSIAYKNIAKELGGEIVSEPATSSYEFTITFTNYETYDSTHTYKTGDKVSYGNNESWSNYECKEDDVTGEWDSSKWTNLEDYGFDITETSGNTVVLVAGSDGTETLPESFVLYGNTATTTSLVESTSLISDGSVVVGGVTLPADTLYFGFERCFQLTIDDTTVEGNIYVIYNGNDAWYIIPTESE